MIHSKPATPAATRAPEMVPNPEGLRTLLLQAREALALATWSEAYKAAGYTGKFQNCKCEAILTSARAVMEQGDALICSAEGTFGLKVVERHLATLESWGYPAQFLADRMSASVAAEAARKAASARKAARA